MPRASSPVGASTLMTRAPRSAKVMVQNGPARTRLKSSTRIPSSSLATSYLIPT